MGVSVQVEHALALHKFNGAAAEVIAALRDVESKASSTEEPADTDAAEALLRQHETVKAELETSGRRLAAVEVGVRVQCSVCVRPGSCFCVCVCVPSSDGGPGAYCGGSPCERRSACQA
jgi:hypothetical protein